MESHPTPVDPQEPTFEPVAEDSTDQPETTPTRPDELERFEDLPNRRQSLRGRDKGGATVFVSHAIAKKLYRCSCCSEGISIGSEHAVTSRVQESKYYAHHHVDFTCVQEVILPGLKDLKIVKPVKATAKAVNKKEKTTQIQ